MKLQNCLDYIIYAPPGQIEYNIFSNFKGGIKYLENFNHFQENKFNLKTSTLNSTTNTNDFNESQSTSF